METNKVFDTWRKLDSEVKPKTNKEMEQILSEKVKRTMTKFTTLIAVDVICCLGVAAYLIITSVNRIGDFYYLLNNIILGCVVVAAMVVSLWALKKLNEGQSTLSLKEHLEQRINLLSNWLQGKYKWVYFILTPIILLLVLLSIHVYFEKLPLVTVLKSEDSMFGIAFGFLFGLFVAYFVIIRIRKFQLANLKDLKDIHGSLAN